MSALFLNGAILVMAAATFHGTGHQDVADISDAYLLLAPLLGTQLAGTLFAVALLFSGQNATMTGTLAGQIVMEGFLNIRLRPWLRRLFTRLIAIIPALITVALYGERGSGALLILSQVILSLQLPFAVFPLVLFTGKSAEDGRARRAAMDARARVAGRPRDRRTERVVVVEDLHVMRAALLVLLRSRPDADLDTTDRNQQPEFRCGERHV
jgi:Mn2+/Fe2+ NRAMP family transporter